MSDVTPARLDEIFEKVKNWGRWGAEDQAGALNLITPQKRAAAAKLVRTGEIVSCARELPVHSNAENRLVLATGNKSELSVGYCTLYGDTVGGLAVLGDVYKRDVYAIARRANALAGSERIPARSIEKAPSAELAPNQFDSDDLPDYAVLDAILAQAIEGGLGAAAIEPPPGADRKLVEQVVARLDRNEYKRRQTPLVLRTSTKAFGSGRRLPIVHRYQ